MVYTFTMAEHQFEVILDGGGPWGFRLQGGKDFGIPLNVSRVTPGSKAAFKQIVAGDIICKINGVDTEGLSHMEAQNHIKNAGSRLRMIVRKGKGISIGDQNAIALGAAGSPKVMTQSEVIHSAGVDHQFNPKPKPFGFSPSSSPSTQSTSPVKVTAPVSSSVHAPKFDPGAYARKKKEELEQRKKAESNVAGDSDILKIINATSISKVPTVPASSEGEEAPAADPGAFRMVYSGRDIHEEVSPGSKSVISSLKDRVSQENSGLNSESKVPSRVFQMLQKQLDEEQPEDLPPPPPELIDDEEPARVSFGSSGPGAQSKTFKMLQDSIGNDQTHQSVFSRPQEDRNKAVPIPMKTSPAPPQQTTVNAIPKPPMPSGPNFKATSPKAPSFNAYSTPNTYKPPASSGTSPLFKPSSSPQPASSPQVTTAKVPSQKTALPIDPSRTPHCHNCNEEIRGPFVSAIGKTWHPEHFACNSCKASLQNQGFVEEQDKLFCEQCYNNFFAPKCASCDKPIIGVGSGRRDLCRHCANVRSVGDELQPTSLREIIVELKSDIQFYEKEEARLKEENQIALKRLRVARWKQNELKKKIFSKEERRDRIEEKIKAAEQRTERINEHLRNNQDGINWIDAKKRGFRDESLELELRIKQAKNWGQQIWRQLTEKLAERSQRYYHCGFVQSKADKIRDKMNRLEDQLGMLKEKREVLLKHGAAKKSSVMKNRALMEQREDDIKKAIDRCSISNQQYTTLKLYKDSLVAETENIKEMRRDIDDQLRGVLRTRENRIINPSYRIQYYR